MTIGKLGIRLTAAVMAFLIAVSGFFVPASAAHAATPSLQAGVLKTQSSVTVRTQAQSDMTVFGVDVSQWQGSINWKKAAKKVQFAIVRCGFGDNFRSQDDTRWLENARACRANGIPMGVYLYSYARNTTMAKSEASHVIRCLREAGLNAKTLELPIYLDLEDASAAGLSRATYKKVFKAFKKKLNAAGYSKVGVYSNSDWWSWRLSTIDLASEYRWVAQWNSTMFAGYPGVAEKGCGIWQYTNSASVGGIRGGVDGNYARYDLAFLQDTPAGSKPAVNNNNESEAPSVYVMYRAKTGDYIYTTNTDERANLKKNGWKAKGTLGKVPNKTSQPVFRFYNGSTKAHYFTSSKSQYNKLVKKRAWVYEGVAFCSQLKKQGAPVYRFTKSSKYRCAAMPTLAGWKANGTAWYATL